MRWTVLGVVAAVVGGYATLVSRPLLGPLGAAIVLVVGYLLDDGCAEELVPELVERDVRARDAATRYDLEDV